MKKTWFSVRAQADDTAPAEISIHAPIGGWNVNAQDFLYDLKQITAKDITLTINSPGGSLIDGIAIYNGLRNHPANVTVRVLGIAASIASVIAMAGNKIVMPANTFMMIHSPMNAMQGNAAEMRDMADLLDKLETSLIGTYMARTGKSHEEIKVLLDAETMMTAAEAVEMGFADEIEPALNITASFDLENLPQNVQDVFNSVTEPVAPDAPVVEPVAPTFAAEINALAKGAGMDAYAEVFIFDAAIATLDDAKAAIKNACEIKALCEFGKKPELARGMIAKRTSAADARAELCDLRAAEADATATVVIQPSNSLLPPMGVPQAGVTASSIWSARKSKGGK